MHLLTIGDPHFKKCNREVTDLMQERIEEHLSNGINYDYIVVLGDTLHTNETVTSPVYVRALRFLRMLVKYSHVILLIGNHDLINEQAYLSDIHFFYAVKDWNHPITVVDRPTVFSGGKIVACPYVPPGRLVEALDSHISDWRKASIVLAHQEIKGCKHGAFISEKGDVWESDYPLLVTGHIHEYQRLGNNVLYPGTPIQHSFGDGLDKGLSAVNLHEDNGWSEERIYLSIKRKKTLHVAFCNLNSVSLDFSDYDYRIIIEHAPTQRSVEQLDIVKAWREQGVKIVIRTTLPTERAIRPDSVVSAMHEGTGRNSYHETLMNKLRSRTELLDMYQEIVKTSSS